MRREKLQGKRFSKNTMYVSGAIIGLAIIALIVAIIIYGNHAKENSQTAKTDIESIAESENQTDSNALKQASSQIGKNVNEISNQTNEVTEKIAINTSNMEVENKVLENTVKEQKTSEKEEKTSKEETKKEETKKQEVKDAEFAKPVEGEIIKAYGKENLIFSETLNEWTTHLGIDIKAEKTTVVKAAEEGTVKAIKNDPRYGLTVIIEHTNGYKSVYSNLLTAEFVVVGEKVSKGQTIGTVGNTATFEIADESHLHFEILKDDVAIDPSIYIK